MDVPEYRDLEPWMLSVMEKYWNGMTWSESTKESQVLEKLDKKQTSGPYAIGKINIPEKCDLCQGTLYGYFASRIEYSEGLRWGKSASCISCGHKPFSESCWCQKCKEARRVVRELQQQAEKQRIAQENAERYEQIEKRVKLINEEVSDLTEMCSYNGWAIALAMLEQSNSEDPFVVTSLNQSEAPLAPSQNMTMKCIQEIVPFLQFHELHPKSASIENDSLHWDGRNEAYRLVGTMTDPKQYLLNHLKKCSTGCADAEFIALDIEELMLNEALEFLERTREEYGLPHQVGDKTMLILKKLILERPLGEVFFLIWRSCTDCAALVQKKSMNRSQASNSIIGTMERLHVRGRDSGWEFKSYKRFKYAKQNWLSYVYFNLVLQLPGEGLEYSWLDVMKRQKLHINIHPDGIIGQDSPLAYEALKTVEPTISTSEPEPVLEI